MTARLRAIPWWGWTLAAAAVIIGVVAAVGGFAETPVTKVPTISLGDTYEGRQVDSSVQSIRLASELPRVLTPQPGNQLAIATIRLVNHDDAPVTVSALTVILVINDIDYIEVSERQYTAREFAGADPLQPGVPTVLLYVWEIPSSVPDDQAAIVGLLESVPDANSVYGDGDFTEPVAVRRIDVTLDRAPSRSVVGS